MLAALAAAAALALQSAHGLSITHDTPVVIPEGTLDSTAVSLAWRDVAQDWYRVLGKLPVVFGAAPKNESLTYVSHGDGTAGSVSQPVVVFLGRPQDLAGVLDPAAHFAAALSGPESHSCCQLPFNSTLGYAPLVCTGTDDLGLVYAAYALSHDVLGVDPQYFFTDNDPAYAGSVDPSSSPDVSSCKVFSLTKASFRYRGFFVNDEDLFGGFQRDPAGGSVFSVAAWDRIFEYILRMRGNAVIVGTAGYPDEESFDQASRRGLYLAQHHITVLGTNVFRWPDAVPYSFRTAPEVLEDLWARVARLQLSRGRRVLWTVGYRGLNDYPCWIDDPTLDTPAKRGALISAAMQRQVDVVHAVAKSLGVDPGAFVTYLWAEMTDLYAQGYLTIPAGVAIVHGDDGTGVVSDPSIVRPGDGLYYHVAMESDRANQLTEMVPPLRVAKELLLFAQRGATAYLILNTSDMRPVPLGIRLVMQWAWDATPLLAAGSLADAAADAVAAWAARQYGAAAAPAVARAVADYFNASAFHNATVSPSPDGQLVNYYTACRFEAEAAADTDAPADAPTPPTVESAVAGDQHFSVLVRDLAFMLARDLRCARAEGRPPTTVSAQLASMAAQAAALMQQTQRSFEFADAEAAAVRAALPAARRVFWDAHLGGHARLYAAAAQAVANLTLTVDSVVAGKPDDAKARAAGALAATEGVLSALRGMEQSPRWRGIYAYDVLDGWQGVHDYVRDMCAALDGYDEQTVVRFWRWGTGTWNDWFWYMRQLTFPFQNPTAWLEAAQRPFMPFATMVNCAAGQAGCRVTPLGISDQSGAASVALNISRPVVPASPFVPACEGTIRILYSLNASAPVSAWEPAPQPLHVTGNATVSAVAECTASSGTWYGTISRAVVTRTS